MTDLTMIMMTAPDPCKTERDARKKKPPKKSRRVRKKEQTNGIMVSQKLAERSPPTRCIHVDW